MDPAQVLTSQGPVPHTALPQLEDKEAVNIPVLKMLKHVAKEGPPCYLVVEANSSRGCGTLKPCYLLHLTAI